jgi:transposase
MRDLGLTPSADSRGARRRPGGLPQTGNPQARRALSEGAWADGDPAQVSRPLLRRLDTLPNPVQDIRGKAQVRRCTRAR